MTSNNVSPQSRPDLDPYQNGHRVDTSSANAPRHAESKGAGQEAISPPRPNLAPSRPGHTSPHLAPSPLPFRGGGAGAHLGDHQTAPLEIDWEARLKTAVEKTLAARAARKAEREEFKRRRDYGLQQRHGRKTARLRRESLTPPQDPGETMPDVPPCCAGLDEPCPQHRQAASGVRHEGPRNRHAAGHRVVGESGKAKPVRDTEEQA